MLQIFHNMYKKMWLQSDKKENKKVPVSHQTLILPKEQQELSLVRSLMLCNCDGCPQGRREKNTTQLRWEQRTEAQHKLCRVFVRVQSFWISPTLFIHPIPIPMILWVNFSSDYSCHSPASVRGNYATGVIPFPRDLGRMNHVWTKLSHHTLDGIMWFCCIFSFVDSIATNHKLRKSSKSWEWSRLEKS